MLLKRLRLRNIRTYEDGEVEFPRGNMLFEGGIGSGKSTLLLAIEFALFGLGNEKGSTLLGLGKNSGSVELEFEAQGETVMVYRSLVRARKSTTNQGVIVPGGVKQGDCWLEAGGRRLVYSPKEMKEAVLKKLNYNEPLDPKAKSVIFRYAVYTPQEEMKEILSQAPEMRLQTIRKALRLEEYKIAKENAHTIANKLGNRSQFLLEGAKRLPELEQELKDRAAEIPTLEEEIRKAGEEIFDTEVELNGHRATRDELRQQLEELIGEARKESEIRSSIQEDLRRATQLRAGLESNREKVREWRSKIDLLNGSLRVVSMSLEEVQGRLAEANRKFAECGEALGRMNHVYGNYSSLIEKKICPTCNQRVDTDSFRAKLMEVRGELDQIISSKAAIEKEIRELEHERQATQAYVNDSSEISSLHDRVFDAEEQMTRDEEELSRIETRRKEMEGRASEAAQALIDYQAVKDEYNGNEGEIRQLERRLEDLRSTRSGNEREVARIRTQIEELEQRVNEIQGNQKRAKNLIEYSNWLEGYFSEAMSRIETSILNNANRELDDEFGRWFSFLVDDPTKSVRIDEDFTPLITQDTYEQDVSNLSGGERTALALAYRLALNKTVQKRSRADSGLLILDEPTDGFSKDQIGKIGDLLRELDLQQTIIVSHERELEGAVDYIFRVQKEDGRSKVVPVGP